MSEPEAPVSGPESPVPEEPGVCHYPAIAMTCTILALFTFISTAELVLRWFPPMADVYRSVKVSVGPVNTVLYGKGMYFLILVGLAIAFAFTQVIRRATSRSTVVVAGATLIVSFVLNWMCRQSLWEPLANLLKGVGVPP